MRSLSIVSIIIFCLLDCNNKFVSGHRRAWSWYINIRRMWNRLGHCRVSSVHIHIAYFVCIKIHFFFRHLAAHTKCFTLFATHFHEITELTKTVPTVRNSHMVAVADGENFTLLYQVRVGVMDKSFGIHVAKIAYFPEDVVRVAQRLYDECEDHYGQLKALKDEEPAAKVFADAIERFGTDLNVDDDAGLEQMMNEIRNDVRSTDSKYFRTAFPLVFQ